MVPTKADAQLFAAQLRTDQTNGEWISPAAGRAASTQARACSALRAHILPRFAERHLAAAPEP